MVDRRGDFGRPDDEYGRDFEYDGPRYYPNGGPRSYHGEDHRGYHSESVHFGNMRRNGPPSRREDGYLYYRGNRDDPHGGRQVEFRDDRDHFRRKPSFPPQRDRSPHSRSGSSLSSRSYSPDKGKSYSYQTQQKKRYEEAYCPPNRESDKERPPSHSVNTSRDGSPQSTAPISKMVVDKGNRPADPHHTEAPPRERADESLDRSSEGPEARAQFEEVHSLEGEREEMLPAKDEAAKMKERRSQAIAAKAREIEQVYRQDCETFGMVVKMLVAKEPSLEKQLQNPLKENLSEIRERCLEDLRHFISEMDEVLLQPEASS